MASNFVSITDFGAVGVGKTDNQAAIQKAFDFAQANAVSVFVPQGVFNHSGTLTANGITVFGSGTGSVLFGTDPSHETVFMTGSGASLSSVELTTNTSGRLSTLDSTAICPDGATNYTIQNVTIEHAGSAGIINYGANHGQILNNTVMDTNADSIHMTNASHDITVQGNLIERSGDDSISIVNYGTSATLSANVTIQGNTIVAQQNGRGIVVVGGHDVQILSNHVEGGPADRAGTYVSAEPAYSTPGNFNIKIDGNTLKDAGGAQSGHGAITVWNGEGGSITNHDVTITNNQIDAPRKDGILIVGSPQNNFTIENNDIYGPRGQGVNLLSTPANSTITNNQVLPLSSYPGDVVPVGTGASNTSTGGGTGGGSPAPEGSVSIAGFGAVGDGTTDNTAAIQKALTFAQANGVSVFVPQGVFNHSGTLTDNGVTIYGTGTGSVLHATNPGHEALDLQGSGAAVSGLEFTTVAGPRLTTNDSSVISPNGATDYVIRNVTIQGAGSAGILDTGSSNGHVLNNTMLDANSASIHLTNGANGTAVEGNLIERSHDDSISVVTYGTTPTAHNLTIDGNTILNQQAGRAITVAGGHDIQVTANHLEDGPSDRAGVYITADPTFKTAGNFNLAVSGNTIKDMGGQVSGEGAVTLNNGEDGSGITNHDISVTNNDIYAPRKDGVLITGAPQSNLTIENNNIYSPNGQGVNVHDTPAASTITNNQVQPLSSYPGDKVPGGGGAASDPNLSTFTLNVAEDPSHGDALLRFLINGQQVGTDQTVTAQHSQGASQNVTFQADLLGQTVHTLDVVNASPVPSGGTAANLFLNSLMVNDVTLQPPQAQVASDTSFDVSQHQDYFDITHILHAAVTHA